MKALLWRFAGNGSPKNIGPWEKYCWINYPIKNSHLLQNVVKIKSFRYVTANSQNNFVLCSPYRDAVWLCAWCSAEAEKKKHGRQCRFIDKFFKLVGGISRSLSYWEPISFEELLKVETKE